MRPRDHCWVCSVWGRTITSDTACDQSEEDRLAREVDDPTAILTRLQFQDLYTPRNLQTSAQTKHYSVAALFRSNDFTAYRQYTKVTDVTPMYTVRFGFTLLFPDFEL